MEREVDYLNQGLHALDLDLDKKILVRLLQFLDELERWNRRINLTAIRDRREALEKHLIDSLCLLRWIEKGPLLDIGSGAGLPAIPLALAKPQMRIVSIDSVAKKISFQKHVRRHFTLEKFEPVSCRIEDYDGGKVFPVVTARAFASVEKIIELVAPFLAPDGRLLLMRGPSEDPVQLANSLVLTGAGLTIANVHEYHLPYSGATRQILEISAA